MKTKIPKLVQKTSRAVAAMTAGKLGQAVWTDYSVSMRARQAYKLNHVVFTCVHEIATSAGSIPFKLVNLSDQSDFANHPILDLLNRPNPYQAACSFWECVYAFYLLQGNSYVEAADMAGSESPSSIEELYCLPPQNVDVILGKRGVAAYKFKDNGREVLFPVNMVNGQSYCMHWKTFNPENMWIGQSALSALGKSIDIHDKTSEWNKSLLDNDARPSGMFVYDDGEDGVLTDEQYKKLKKQVEEEYAGSRNAGKMMLLEGGMKWQQMSMSPMDMDFISSKNLSGRDIAVTYGYPPVLLGLPEDNTYNNQKEARLALWTDTIMPLCNSMCSHLNRWLLPLFGMDENEIQIRPNYEEIGALQPIRDAQWEKANTSQEYLEVNERRKLVGYSTKPGYDVIFVNATMLPIAEAVNNTGNNNDSSSEEGKDLLNLKRLITQIPLEAKGASDADKREVTAQKRLLAALERAYAPRIKTLLNEIASEAKNVYIRYGSAEKARNAIQDMEPKLKRLLKSLYLGTADIAGDRIFRSFKSIMGETFESKAQEAQSLFELEMISYATDQSLKKASSITEGAITRAREVFTKKIVEGSSIEETATALFNVIGGSISESKAKQIAATETHQAYNTASYSAINATGLDVDKKWLTIEDGSARPSHSAVNGKTVPKEETFKVGKAFLRFPGDPTSGAAEEVINCRCAVRYIPRGI